MILQDLVSQLDFQQLIKIRRTLHQIPQVGLEEHQTSKFVRRYLSKIQGVEVLDPIPNVETAVIAIIKVQNSKERYLFRCELDALPWPQKSGEQFSSNNGLHHACGHDAHMSIMLLACKKIAQSKKQLKRSIIFCFQPGQQGKGGAKKLIQNFPQLLDSVKYAFALHGGNHFPAGFVLASSGVISANSQRFQIKIKGKGCHVMIPQHGIDANFIGCSLVTKLYTLKQMKLNPLERGIISVTKVQGGLGAAIISENFHISGTLRMLTSKSQQKMRQQITNFTKGYCQGLGAQQKVQFFSSHYRSVQNHQAPTKIIKSILKKILPEDKIKQQLPSFNGEDFCEFSQRVPSCYFLLGAGRQGSFNENNQSQFPLHSNKHRLDEKFMILGVKIWVELSFSQN